MKSTGEINGQKESRKKGLIGTFAFHGILLLALLLLKLLAPVPPPEEGGILINFGNSDQGTGNIQPEQVTSNQTSEESNASQLEQPKEKTAEAKPKPNLTQDVEEAPKITKDKPKPVVEKPKPKTVEQPKKPEQPKVDANALYPGKKNKPSTGSSGSEGETGKPGDQGSPDGDKNATSHTGSGKGSSGTIGNLEGRTMIISPQIEDRSQETGKIIIDITVDKYGKVTNATDYSRESTISNLGLRNKAKEASYKAKFSPCNRIDCAEEQKGTITYYFILK